MDTEKIIFIVLALLFSVFSMFLKSKKQKQPNIPDLQENSNIYSKKSKKKQKLPNIENITHPVEKPEVISQNTDLENEINLLEDFEGSDLQKAFLFSEIFKNTNN
jgi:type III secretory pathway component EscV